MNADWIVAAFVIIDTVLERLEHRSHVLAQVPDAEILTIAVVAAKFFQNHHERAVRVLCASGYLSGTISVSRCNRRLHALADSVVFMATTLGELFAQGEVFVIDSLPLPVCRRVRARRCRKVRGRAYCGYCAAKKEKCFGWRLHLICTPAGLPVSFTRLPAAYHDLTPLHERAFALALGSWVTRRTIVRRMKRAYGQRPGYACSPSARRIWRRIPGFSTRWSCGNIVIRLRPSIASWKRWVSSACTPAPTWGLI
jgi:hypothetical protein